MNEALLTNVLRYPIIAFVVRYVGSTHGKTGVIWGLFGAFSPAVMLTLPPKDGVNMYLDGEHIV